MSTNVSIASELDYNALESWSNVTTAASARQRNFVADGFAAATRMAVMPRGHFTLEGDGIDQPLSGKTILPSPRAVFLPQRFAAAT